MQTWPEVNKVYWARESKKLDAHAALWRPSTHLMLTAQRAPQWRDAASGGGGARRLQRGREQALLSYKHAGPLPTR
jgi:hypothetical protein